jgi:Ser/Thr protein kinase RdoA (MazF antagonist)
MSKPDLSGYDLAVPVECYDVPQQGTNNIVQIVHTGDGRFMWKQYAAVHEVASIRYEHRLLTGLAESNISFAVPAPIRTRQGTFLERQGNSWGALTHFFAGERCNPERLAEVELLGAATGELQRMLREVPTEPRPGRSLFGALFDFPRPTVEPLSLTPQQIGAPSTHDNDALCGWWREEGAQLEAFFKGAYRSLPWQVCHNDVTPANVLLAQGRVVAVLDFEFACPAAPALDVAMGLRMTMRIWENREPWEAVRRYMQGYNGFVNLTAAEIDALPMLLRLRSAIPILWWMGRDPSQVLRSIGYLQNMTHWLDRHQEQLIEVVSGMTAEGNTAKLSTTDTSSDHSDHRHFAL